MSLRIHLIAHTTSVSLSASFFSANILASLYSLTPSDADREQLVDENHNLEQSTILHLEDLEQNVVGGPLATVQSFDKKCNPIGGGESSSRHGREMYDNMYSERCGERSRLLRNHYGPSWMRMRMLSLFEIYVWIWVALRLSSSFWS